MTDKTNPFSSLWLISWIVWRIPSRRSMKMAEFSHTEAGSSLDMLAAAEATVRPDLRKKFFRHAMDEFRHARMFAERSLALSSGAKAADLLEDPEYLVAHGIRGEKSLYEELGRIRFPDFRLVGGATSWAPIQLLQGADERGSRFPRDVHHNLQG